MLICIQVLIFNYSVTENLHRHIFNWLLVSENGRRITVSIQRNSHACLTLVRLVRLTSAAQTLCIKIA